MVWQRLDFLGQQGVEKHGEHEGYFHNTRPQKTKPRAWQARHMEETEGCGCLGGSGSHWSWSQGGFASYPEVCSMLGPSLRVPLLPCGYQGSAQEPCFIPFLGFIPNPGQATPLPFICYASIPGCQDELDVSTAREAGSRPRTPLHHWADVNFGRLPHCHLSSGLYRAQTSMWALPVICLYTS